jgi:hypothetical protein
VPPAFDSLSDKLCYKVTNSRPLNNPFGATWQA